MSGRLVRVAPPTRSRCLTARADELTRGPAARDATRDQELLDDGDRRVQEGAIRRAGNPRNAEAAEYESDLSGQPRDRAHDRRTCPKPKP